MGLNPISSMRWWMWRVSPLEMVLRATSRLSMASSVSRYGQRQRQYGDDQRNRDRSFDAFHGRQARQDEPQKQRSGIPHEYFCRGEIVEKKAQRRCCHHYHGNHYHIVAANE